MMPVTPRREQPDRRRLGRLERIERVDDVVGVDRDAGRLGEGPGRGDLALRGHVVRRAQQQADPGVAEREEVAHRLLGGDRVVARHPREARARRWRR